MNYSDDIFMINLYGRHDFINTVFELYKKSTEGIQHIVQHSSINSKQSAYRCLKMGQEMYGKIVEVYFKQGYEYSQEEKIIKKIVH